MKKREWSFCAIGVIRSPHMEESGAPIQPTYAAGVTGRVEIFPEYHAAMVDLAGFERLWLLYLFDRASPFQPRVVPYRDTVNRGLFATRAPTRPNPIGISAVRLLRCEDGVIHVADLDVLDGTPLLDVKPYVPAFDAFPSSRAGWLEKASGGEVTTTADGRFSAETPSDDG